MIIALILVETLLAVSAQLLLRHGAMRLEVHSLTPAIVIEAIKNLPIMAGLALHGISFFLYVYILTKLQLNIFYPVATGASLVLITVFSVFLLKESLNVAQVCGIFIIMGGIVLVFIQR